MLIPRGEIIHESLATSYVLVEALVADLCEGGFSGIVEVVLRDTDSFIAIASGNVAAVLEKCSDQDRNGAALTYTRTTVEHLSERSRRERGRVSIYGYSADTASAVAGRINAQPLYVGLSSEFTDLEKMIRKLVRERDREWFIELNTESGAAALIHMRDAQCRVITSTGDADSGALDLAANAALGKLLAECNRAGGTFDVYFTHPAKETDEPAEHTSAEPIPAPSPVEAAIVHEEPVEPAKLTSAEPIPAPSPVEAAIVKEEPGEPAELTSAEPIPAPSPVEVAIANEEPVEPAEHTSGEPIPAPSPVEAAIVNEEPVEVAEHTSGEPIPSPSPVEAAIVNEEPGEPNLASLQHDLPVSLPSNDSFSDSSREAQRLTLPDLAAPSLEHEDQPRALNGAGVPVAPTQPGFAAPEETLSSEAIGDSIEPKAGDLSLLWNELPQAAADAEAMAEIKRLMGEIARVIEQAAQAVGRPDSFSMSLRAGQLKIADRFPFLDPFAGEFEYLAGEIVFVGHATAEEFVVGLTEALKLAIEAVTRSTVYADKFRSYATEDLQKLHARERADFERFGLDQVIQQIITF